MSPPRKAVHAQLPATIDPIQLAERGSQLSGSLPVRQMPRLKQACVDDSGEVLVDLRFERGEGESVYLMHGRLQAHVRVVCQRCLEPMELTLEVSPWLMLARPDARDKDLADEADILVVDKPLLLSSLVEDELLLAWPMVPTHELNQCPAKTYIATPAVQKDLSVATQEKKNPFSVLRKIKKNS
ncbi:MAG: DUF177 domain-containing protein [Gammaproteobacteria bacterium]|nr:DUF177 domain-containing protein [Gammaproteobacteria bacterium]